MIGWEKGARFLDESREEEKQKKNNPWLLLTLDLNNQKKQKVAPGNKLTKGGTMT